MEKSLAKSRRVTATNNNNDDNDQFIMENSYYVKNDESVCSCQ